MIFDVGLTRSEDPGPLQRFVEAALLVDGVVSVGFSRSRGSLAIRHAVEPGRESGLLSRLSLALGKHHPRPGGRNAPRWLGRNTAKIFRHGPTVSTCQVVDEKPGVLVLRHPWLKRNSVAGGRARRLLSNLPGVRQVSFDWWKRTLEFRYETSFLSVERLLSLAEDAIESPDSWPGLVTLPKVERFWPSNVNIVVAALADFALAPLQPVCALVLLGTNLRTFREAFQQVRTRKMGLPVLYTTIVAATLGSGQFLASAIMSWSFKFWNARLRRELAERQLQALDECLPLPALARFSESEGGELYRPSRSLQIGDRFMLSADDLIPVDGRIIEGSAIVDEQCLRGSLGAVRKTTGDLLLAGSKVIAGSVLAEVATTVDGTVASSIVRSFLAATSLASEPAGVNGSSETLAERAILPTLATAGFGFLTGGLNTACAILRPDYATGPSMHSPLEVLRLAAHFMRQGALIRSSDALTRLSSIDVIVLEDVPELQKRELEISAIRTRAPENVLLRSAASAFRYLADERADCLAAECLARGMSLVDLPCLSLEDGVTVAAGGHRLRVREEAGRGRDDPSGPLSIEIDETVVGVVEFRRSVRLTATRGVKRLLLASNATIMLVSDKPQDELAGFARELGIGHAVGGLSSGVLERLFESFHERGLRSAFIGDCASRVDDADRANVAVSLGGDVLPDTSLAAVTLLHSDLGVLADLWDRARALAGDQAAAKRFVLVPNLICVAGAFVGATPLASVLLSNLGTLGVFGKSSGLLGEINTNILPDLVRSTPKLRSRPSLPKPAERPSLHFASKADSKLGAAGAPIVERSQEQKAPSSQTSRGSADLDVKSLPKEVGVMLMAVGVLGVVLPGVIGAPALVLGGVVVWPKAFGKVEKWLEKRCPKVHKQSLMQIHRYLIDLDRRFPSPRPQE